MSMLEDCSSFSRSIRSNSLENLLSLQLRSRGYILRTSIAMKAILPIVLSEMYRDGFSLPHPYLDLSELILLL